MAAGAGVGGVSQGPTPWWQLPGGQGNLDNLRKSAPPGYEYDPIKMQYIRTPASQGGAVKQFNDAAMPDSLKGLFSSATSGITGSGGIGLPGGGTAPTGVGSSVSGGASGLGGSPAGQGLARVGGLQVPDMKSATDAAFAGAKDKSGQIARSSIDSLRGELGATGNLGSGAEVQGVRDTVNNAAGVEGQAARDISMKQADIGADFAKTQYGGGIAQRGQDVSAQEAQASLAQQKELAQARLAFETNNANSQRQLQLLTLALSGLKGGAAGVPGYSY